MNYIDPSEIDLYGWEEYKSDAVVGRMVELILNGIDIPPINIEVINEKEFQIAKEKHPKDSSRLDGGHHRALAYTHLKRNIPCNIVRRVPNLYEGAIKIKDIILVPDKKISSEGIYIASDRKRIHVVSLLEFNRRNQ